MSESADLPFVDSTPTRPEDVFYLTWGEETAKQTIPRLNDALQRMSTLATAMLGGSLFFVTADVLAAGFRATAMTFFLAALVASFYGLLPKSEVISLGDPAAIRRFKVGVAAHRQKWLSLACLALCAGFGVAVFGAVVKAFG